MPMKQNYSQPTMVAQSAKTSGRARRSGLRKETVELIRQFARAYTPVAGFPGIIAN
ncbi:unknown [Prevotella sp. CAG:873]|jgi:hypothetical protein|nr:unknown [Prevotella sp. CAG:873]